MRVYTLSDMRSEKKLRVYTASEAKGLIPSIYMQFHYFLDATLNGWFLFIYMYCTYTLTLNKYRCIYRHFTKSVLITLALR